MQLKYHPYFKPDVQKAAHDFWVSLTTGKHWDTQLVSLLPSVANAGSEHVRYTLDACYTQGLIRVSDIDWRASLMSHMCWMLGDCEAEIRVKSGADVTLLECV